MGKKTKGRKANSKAKAGGGTHREQMQSLSDAFTRTAFDASSMRSQQNVPANAQQLFSRLHKSTSFQDYQEMHRELIRITGTKVDEINDKDEFGDGDQSRLENEQKAQIFRNLWTSGADMSACVQKGNLSYFALYCVQGNKGAVERLVKQTAAVDDKDDENRRLVQLLERRESAFRTPPLFLTMGFAKHVQSVVQWTGCDPNSIDHVGVAALLLRYGARPDAKDVAGKSAVHWGAGCMSNAVTRQIVDMCIRATRSCRHYGQEVQLDGLLTKKEYNGITGILGGYIEEQDRRVVHIKMDGERKELAILPKNIFFNGETILDESYKLVNVPDRLGAVALHEIVMSQNVDAAKFLCNKERNASVDVADITGLTVRQMIMRPLGGLSSQTMDVIKKWACRLETAYRCGNCNKEEEADVEKYLRCARCHFVYYCSRECQLEHWPAHKQDCNNKAIKLLRTEIPYQNDGLMQSSQNRMGVYSQGKFAAPTGVKVNETFWIKVQCSNKSDHLVYDKTRTCQFSISPKISGYDELKRRVQAERGSLGQKTHFQAKFDENGDLIVYPHTAELKTW